MGSPASPGRRSGLTLPGSRLFCPPLGGATTFCVDTQPDPDIQIAGYRIEARVGRGGMGEVYRAGAAQSRPEGRAQGPRSGACRRRPLPPALPARVADRGQHRPPERHPDLRYRRGRRAALHRHALRRRLDLATLLEREGRLDPARRWPSWPRWPARWTPPTPAGWSTATSSRPTSCWPRPRRREQPRLLCDFGLIKQVGTEQAFSALTATDQFVGTIPYVAPEQIEGGEVDGRTDVYSLGCVLFHCLTGSVPYQGENDVEVVFAHLRDPPPAISSRLPGLPVPMDAVIARAMAKVKEDRYPSCSELVAAMDEQFRAGARRPAPPADDDTRAMVLAPAPVPAALAAPTDPAAPIPAPPLAQPAPAPAARPIPGPAPVHQGGRGGRRWLRVVAAVVLPVVAYVAAAQLLAGERRPEVDTTNVAGGPPATSRPPSTAGSGCPGGWTRPAVGTPARSAPLAAIRADMGCDRPVRGRGDPYLHRKRQVEALVCQGLPGEHPVATGPLAGAPGCRRPARGRGHGAVRHQGLCGTRLAGAARPGWPAQRRSRLPCRQLSGGMPVPELSLEIVEGTGAGRMVALAGGVTIGRGRDADLVLADELVSRHHARVAPRGSGAVVEDLGSRNGTFLNGDGIHGLTRLEPGDQLQLGVTLVELRSARQIAERPSAVHPVPPPLAVPGRAPDYLAGVADTDDDARTPAVAEPAPRPSPRARPAAGLAGQGKGQDGPAGAVRARRPRGDHLSGDCSLTGRAWAPDSGGRRSTGWSCTADSSRTSRPLAASGVAAATSGSGSASRRDRPAGDPELAAVLQPGQRHDGQDDDPGGDRQQPADPEEQRSAWRRRGPAARRGRRSRAGPAAAP